MRCGLCTTRIPLNNESIVLKCTYCDRWFPVFINTVGNTAYVAHVLKCTAALFLHPALTCSLADFIYSAVWGSGCCCCMCPSCLVFSLSVCPAVFVCVCLFVDEGAEDKVGPLQHCPGCGPTASREWRKHLAPSISVSVPDDEPYNSDEEYYEHPLFSSEWTGSSTHPSATVKSTEVLLGHDEGELNMVPFCSSSPLLTCHPFHYMCAWDCCFLGRETQGLFFLTWKWHPFRVSPSQSEAAVWAVNAALESVKPWSLLKSGFLVYWPGLEQKQKEQLVKRSVS